MPAARSVDEHEAAMRRPRGQRAATGVLERPSRKDRVRQIEALARQGLEVREIADQVGLAVSTVHKYRRDPDGESERARRESYRGRCGVCGRATSGSEGPGRAPRWCRDHAPAQRRRWSDEQLLEAIRDWARLTGAPPTVYDWSPAHAPEGHAGAARYLDELGRWPNARSVARRFGSLAAAVRRADLRR